MKNIISTGRNDQTWFRQWFDSAFYRQLYAHRDEVEAKAFIEELLNMLNPPPGAAMLDLGCGTGRHSKQLAKGPYHVTGLDLAASSISQAKRWETERLHFARHDMRDRFGKNLYDYVFSFFTSFGYFAQAQNEKVIHNMTLALQQGGTLVLDYFNANISSKNLVPVESREIDGIIYYIRRWMDEGHFYKQIRIDDGSPLGIKEYTEKVAIYHVEDFEAMFTVHGLALQEVYGDYKLNDFDGSHSPRMILVAKKL